MSLRRDLLVSFGLQGAGAAAVLLATLLLGARLGPVVQGGFSHLKAEIEFASAFAMFGLPQALFFHVKAGHLGARAALLWVVGCALVAVPLTLACAIWRAEPAAVAAMMAITVGAAVAHGQLRALLLVDANTAWFNVLTALPQLLVLAGVAGVVWRGGAEPAWWVAIFGLAYAVAAVLAWRRFAAVPVAAPATQAGWRALVRYGLAAWLAAALVTAAILLVQQWVEASQGRAALGQFTMAMTLVQVPLTPVSYAAPLLLRRWMDYPGAAASRRIAAILFALLMLAAASCWLASLAWPDLGLGRAYAGVARALAVLLAGGAAEAASRVLTVQASARGTPWIGVRAECARWMVLALGWLALPLPSLATACAVWAAGAWASAAVFAFFMRAGAQGRTA